MKHPKTLYVIADGAHARFVEKRTALAAGESGIRLTPGAAAELPAARFDTVREIVAADAHRRSRDLGTDRPGRTFESATTARHAVEPRQDPHEASKRTFMHEVAAVLNEAGAGGEFNRLVLVASARVIGELRGALDGATGAKVAAELKKDLSKVPDADLADHLGELRTVS